MNLFKGFVILIAAYSSTGFSRTSSLRVGSPSLYSTSVIDAASATCAESEKLDILNREGHSIIRLCENDRKECRFAGSCSIKMEDGKIKNINYVSYDKAKDTSYFALSACPYGYGYVLDHSNHYAETCLIPYVSLAVDPTSEHRAGDVIYVPEIDGWPLPDGTIHDGYFIVSDQTKNLAGTGFDRYMFFTGTEKSNLPNNTFNRLATIDQQFSYRSVTGAESLAVLKKYQNLMTTTGRAR